MKWHDYPLFYRAVHSRYKLGGASEMDKAQEVLTLLRRGLSQLELDNSRISESQEVNTFAQILCEAWWVGAKRPYYNVWPSVIVPFTKVDLSKVSCRDVVLPTEEHPVLIRFPQGHELGGKVRSILAAHTAAKDPNSIALLLGIDYGRTFNENLPCPATLGITLDPSDNISNRIALGRSRPGYAEGISTQDLSSGLFDDCVRLVVTICLLNNNTDLIEQSPLEVDRTKYEATHDPKYLEKAARRGKLEWDIGRRIEAQPGFRSPHFAIRWMGTGQPKKPVVRPIRGCLVRRKDVLSVPTGFLDEKISENP